jgi:hypothetical protein
MASRAHIRLIVPMLWIRIRMISYAFLLHHMFTSVLMMTYYDTLVCASVKRGRLLMDVSNESVRGSSDMRQER